jgi:hypothetical protein
MALMALIVACVLAHAGVLGGLPRLHAAPSQDAAQHSVMRLTSVSMAMPETPQRDAAVTQRSALDAVPSAAPTPRGSAARAGPARTAPAVSREPAPAAPPSSAEAAIEHLPTSALDVPPMPRSAPAEQYVEHAHRSGLPMQIRIYIDARGSVTEASLLGVAPGDEEAAEQVMAMFRETAFSPGRLQGREVASFIDIELVLEPALPPLGRIVRQ